MKSFWLFVLLLGAQVFGARQALAEDLSVLGADFVVRAGTGDYLRGMNEVVVSLKNGGERRRQGTIRIESKGPNPSMPGTRASAAFDVAAGADVSIRVPVFAMDASTVTVESEDAVFLAQEFRASPEQALRVFDAHDVPRLRAVLENLPMNLTTPAVAGPYSPYSPAPSTGGLRIRVVPAMYPRGVATDSGRVLPSRVPTWHGMHVVFMPTSRLRAITSDEFAALQGFTLAGGTLALSVSRPEDLESERVVALIGDRAVESPPSNELTRSFPKPFMQTPEYLKYDKVTSRRDEVVLHGYSGGNLVPTLYGSSAAFGLGQVTLLSFDLDNPLHVDDPWVGVRLLELVRQSYERRQQGTAGLGVLSGAPGGMGMRDDSVQRILEGSSSVRWFAVAVSLLLCAYGALVGPVLFNLGKRRGDLLLPLRLLPILALGAFGLIVVLGTLTKGRGKSTRLAYVETGAGMSLGVGARYRGFFTPSSEDIDVGCSTRHNHLGAPFLAGKEPNLAIDGERLRIGDFESQPSQTVIVREDGFFDLGGPIDIERSASGVLTIENRTPHELRDVLVKSDADEWFFTRSIAAGDSFSTEAGPSTDRNLVEWATRIPPNRVRPFEDYGFDSIFYDADAEDEETTTGSIWRALDGANTDPKRWFPSGTPVLLAKVQEREPAKNDSGLSIGASTFVVRVVGLGAAP